MRGPMATTTLLRVALLGSALACSLHARPIASLPDEQNPVDEALGLPEWLTLKGHQRTRFESFDEHFRAGLSGHGQGIFTRTALQATARADAFEGSLELMDSRQFDTPPDLPLGTGIVNTFEVLQAYGAVHFDDVYSGGDHLRVLFGRHTMDVGSRRLVARNRFRNTINGFTGLNALWESDGGDRIQAFYVLPVQRLPRDLASQRDNDQQLDEERSQVQFYGVHTTTREALHGMDAEVYLFGLHEEDGRELNTRNRDLWTFGGRLVKGPAAGEFDHEFEFAYQVGDSRASSSSTDTTDLDHEAWFLHASTGYRWDAEYSPRVELLFDYATGDDDPTDGEWNRFDTLFGARRFEYGPTGIFGAFARSNILTPGVRLFVEPTDDTQLMIANRLHYLASDRDAWTTSGLVDPTGGAGDYLGNLLEFRVRWDPEPFFRLEFGAAHLFAGSFIDDAPNATTQGDSTYVYVASVFRFG